MCTESFTPQTVESRSPPQRIALMAELDLNPGYLPSPDRSPEEARFPPNSPSRIVPEHVGPRPPHNPGGHRGVSDWGHLPTPGVPLLSSCSCLPRMPASSPLGLSQVQNNRMWMDSKKEQLRVEGQARAPGRHVARGRDWVSTLSSPPCFPAPRAQAETQRHTTGEL